MFYELWNLRSGNIINTYDSESAALTAVRQLLAINGEGLASSLSLAFEDDDEHTVLVAKGEALAQLARRLPGAQGSAGSDAAPERRAV